MIWWIFRWRELWNKKFWWYERVWAWGWEMQQMQCMLILKILSWCWSCDFGVSVVLFCTFAKQILDKGRPRSGRPKSSLKEYLGFRDDSLWYLLAKRIIHNWSESELKSVFDCGKVYCIFFKLPLKIETKSFLEKIIFLNFYYFPTFSLRGLQMAFGIASFVSGNEVNQLESSLLEEYDLQTTHFCGRCDSELQCQQIRCIWYV